MKKYINPDLNVIYLESEDMITTSTGVTAIAADDCGYTPWGDIFGA